MSVLLYLFFTIVMVEKADSQEYVEGNMVQNVQGHFLQDWDTCCRGHLRPKGGGVTERFLQCNVFLKLSQL